MSTDERSQTAEYLEILEEGAIDVLGRMPWSSNGTFLVACSLGGARIHAVYKPLAGERALWDFPGGLYRREVAAYRLSEALGWDLVPETVLRQVAPFGVGSLQRFVNADFSQHYFTMIDSPEYSHTLHAMCAFDVVANNADRKSGHCLLGDDGRVLGIDNGLSFHVEPKLRTVIWEFVGEELPPDLIDGLVRLCSSEMPELDELLDTHEMNALRGRAHELADTGRFPHPDPEGRPYPWPLV